MAEAGVLVDGPGHAQNAIMAWHDPRGAEQADALPAELAHDLPARTGLPVSHVASVFKLAWLRDHGLDLHGLQWLSVPEFVILRLGGERVAELSLLGRTGLLDVHANRPWPPILTHLGVDDSLLPAIVAAGQPVGTVRANHPVAAIRGAVLTVAGHDHAVAAAAAGCGEVGSALDSFGTSEGYLVAVRHVPAPDVVRHLALHGVSVYPHVVRGMTGLIAGTRTGLVLRRIQRMLSAEHEPARGELDRAALELGHGGAPDVHVGGYTLSDREVTVSIDSDTFTPAHLWRAALDGGVVHGQHLLARFREVGVPVDRLVVTGGWTRLASVVEARSRLAATVEICAVDEPGCYGAAGFARWAAGPGAAAAGDRRPPSAWFTTGPCSPATSQTVDAEPGEGATA